MWLRVISAGLGSSYSISTRAEETLVAVAELTYEVSHGDRCFLTAARVDVNNENIEVVQYSLFVCVCLAAQIPSDSFL